MLLYENEQNEREVIQWRLLVKTLKRAPKTLKSPRHFF